MFCGRCSLTVPTVLLLTVMFGSCAGAERFAPDQKACDEALRDAEAVDALDWLKTPPGPNRLGPLSTDDGLALVYKLEMRGAARVVVVGPRNNDQQAGQVAKGLAFTLPSDVAQRRGLFELYAQQVRAAGFTPRADEGQDCLFLAFE